MTAMIEIFKYVKVDNKVLRNMVKNAIIDNFNANGKGAFFGSDYNEIKAFFEKKMNDDERVEYSQMQNAVNYFRYSSAQSAFRAKYNFN